MTEAKEVLDAIVAKMRAVPELVKLLGDENSIYEYGDEAVPTQRSVDEAMRQMETPSMMVALESITVDTRWRWHFVVYLKTEIGTADDEALPSYVQMFRTFVDGIPDDGEGIRLYDSSIHVNFDPMENVSLERAVADDRLEYWFIRFDLSEIFG